MKAVLLAGGLGTRISEESHLRPKPMIEIGGQPILWHIMKLYYSHGITEFIICCGYKGYVIKEYFANYFLHTSDVTLNLAENSMDVHHKNAEPWKVTLIDTGQNTMTGGRLRRVRAYIDGTFCLTYGDGVSDVDVSAVIATHNEAGLEATVTAVQPSGRFGALKLSDNLVTSFHEKPVGDGNWINGGFFVCEPSVFDLISDDSVVWEQSPMESLAERGQLGCFRHSGFWSAMDTLRDKKNLEEMWATGAAPWKSWN